VEGGCGSGGEREWDVVVGGGFGRVRSRKEVAMGGGGDGDDQHSLAA
jgi:hypothetical protein